MHNPYTMNSATGKEILAWLRAGDYAHPGEAQGIDRMLQACPVTLDYAATSVLDAGCGRGGTLGYLHRSGFTSCRGFDSDAESIAYAQPTYPTVEFAVGDLLLAASVFPDRRFTLVTAVCVLHLFDDQQRLQILGQLRQLSETAGWLAVFDYTSGRSDLIGELDGWSPLDPDGFAQMGAQAGWQLDTFTDITDDFILWYSWLVNTTRSHARRIITSYGHQWLSTVESTYGNQLLALRRGSLGGGIWWLRAQ